MKLSQIKLANALKLGRVEEIVFSDSPALRSHGTEIELVSWDIPAASKAHSNTCQVMVKLTDKQTKEISYTSLMNVIYFKVSGDPTEKVVKRGKATI